MRPLFFVVYWRDVMLHLFLLIIYRYREEVGLHDSVLGDKQQVSLKVV